MSEPSSIVSFNVGGTKFRTLASTIQKSPSSLLAVLLRAKRNHDDKKDDDDDDDSSPSELVLDEDGAIFIDRPPHLFSLILDFLRNDKNVRTCSSLPSQDTPKGVRERYNLMREMCDHYNMADSAIAIAPRTFLFDPSHTSPGLDISKPCLTATINQGQINQWNNVRCSIPLITDGAMFTDAHPMLVQKLNRFSICVDRDINVMIGAQNNPPSPRELTIPAEEPKSSAKKVNRRLSANFSSSPLGRKLSQGRLQASASQANIPKGTVLQFTSLDRLSYRPCKLQLGVVSAAYQCVPINQPLIPETKDHETLQPMKTPHMYACPVNGSLKSSETFSIWFDAKSKELIFKRGDTTLYKYLNADNLSGKMNWYFCVSFQAVQPNRFITIIPNH